MSSENIIYGADEAAVFNQVTADMNADPNFFQYRALIVQAGRKIVLDIDIDPGGGFESGFATTILSAPLQTSPGFDFAIHHQGILDEIGKLFGMQDIETGFSEFDSKVIVKSSDEESVKALFQDQQVRHTFGSLEGFTLQTKTHELTDQPNAPFLEFNITRGITDPAELRTLYNAFFKVLQAIDPAVH